MIKRSDGQIEEDRVEVARLHAEGYSLREIVEIFHDKGRDEITLRMVQNDWERTMELWAQSRIDDVAFAINKEMHGIEGMLRLAWNNYREADLALKGLGDASEEEVETTREGDKNSGSSTSRKTVRSRKELLSERQYWFNKITSLSERRGRITGADKSGLNILIDNSTAKNAQISATPPKGYISFNPDEWPEPETAPAALPEKTEEIVEGFYE